MKSLTVPFHRPSLGEAEISEVVDTLRSGWLTTGPKTKRFEAAFAAAVGAKHAVAVNSCTAALHLAVEALGLRPHRAVLVPTMTFAATAEVVRYQGAIPILVDCDPRTLNMSLEDAAKKIEAYNRRLCRAKLPEGAPIVGILPVHVGGFMMNVDELQAFARHHRMWLVEDAAHALPAATRTSRSEPWRRCGEGTAAVTCFSFYANKTITTGEGGMAVTDDANLAERMRIMSLHGLSRDAWLRYSGGGWDYSIVAPGFKYNLTDIAASIGLHQLARAEELRRAREAITRRYFDALADVEEIELPAEDSNRMHSWHLFAIRLNIESLAIDRDQFIRELDARGIGSSVHWRPLHLHTYYREKYSWRASDFPVATREWRRLVSLPLYPTMSDRDVDAVTDAVRAICVANVRKRVFANSIGKGANSHSR